MRTLNYITSDINYIGIDTILDIISVMCVIICVYLHRSRKTRISEITKSVTIRHSPDESKMPSRPLMTIIVSIDRHNNIIDILYIIISNTGWELRFENTTYWNNDDVYHNRNIPYRSGTKSYSGKRISPQKSLFYYAIVGTESKWQRG